MKKLLLCIGLLLLCAGCAQKGDSAELNYIKEGTADDILYIYYDVTIDGNMESGVVYEKDSIKQLYDILSGVEVDTKKSAAKENDMLVEVRFTNNQKKIITFENNLIQIEGNSYKANNIEELRNMLTEYEIAHS